VDTPRGLEYTGKRFTGKVKFLLPAACQSLYVARLLQTCSALPQLCGVSILRAGEVLEPALLSVCKDPTVGKILIQTNETTGEPEVG